MHDAPALPMPGYEKIGSSIVHRGADAKARLAELGLTLEVLEQALHYGHNGAERTTGSHSKIAAGTYRWHETVAALRSALVAERWAQKDDLNAPRIISPDGKVSLMVATGNQNTGTKQMPKNATPKGIMTQQDVWNNGISDQQAIEEVEAMLAGKRPLTWVLLYFYSAKRNHLRAELSLPAVQGMEGGYITRWDERIVLPTIEFEAGQSLSDAQPDTTPGIDFFIEDAEAI